MGQVLAMWGTVAFGALLGYVIRRKRFRWRRS